MKKKLKNKQTKNASVLVIFFTSFSVFFSLPASLQTLAGSLSPLAVNHSSISLRTGPKPFKNAESEGSTLASSSSPPSPSFAPPPPFAPLLPPLLLPPPPLRAPAEKKVAREGASCQNGRGAREEEGVSEKRRERRGRKNKGRNNRKKVLSVSLTDSAAENAAAVSIPWYLRSVSLYAALAAAETLRGGLAAEEEEEEEASFFFFPSPPPPPRSFVPFKRFSSMSRMKSLALFSHSRPLASDLAPRSAPRSISSSGIENRRRKEGSEELTEAAAAEAEAEEVEGAEESPPPPAVSPLVASLPRLLARSSLSMFPPTSERTMAARAAPKWPSEKVKVVAVALRRDFWRRVF